VAYHWFVTLPALDRLEAPLPANLLDELCAVWEQTFATSYDGFRPALLGAEAGIHRDVVWVRREGADLAGTCHLTTVRSHPALGGFGEVATAPRFRGRGIAAELCGLARDEFLQAGGRALFLGTGNPAAARIYERLGWRPVPGTSVMALIATDENTPETFLSRHFRPGGDTVVEAMTAAARIPMIPLLVSPHPSVMLDANVGMVSTTFAVQRSCMGLYPRYEALIEGGRGAAFCACAENGRLVGLATARMGDSGRCAVDVFTHRQWDDAWPELAQACLEWGADHGVTRFVADVVADDVGKQRAFERLDFEVDGPCRPFVADDQSFAAVRLERR
jgi:GNAT superfamily N-acetyltransferase